MHLRLTCDITQEQIDCGYDRTLLSLHSKYVDWVLGLGLPIIGFHIMWEDMPTGDPHLSVIVDLLSDDSDGIGFDSKFFDKIRLGGKDDG